MKTSARKKPVIIRNLQAIIITYMYTGSTNLIPTLVTLQFTANYIIKSSLWILDIMKQVGTK